MSARYSVEVYHLPDESTPLEHFESEVPFGAFSVGDDVYESHWREDGKPDDPPIRIVRIMHLLVKHKRDGQDHHKIMLYCESV